MKIDLKEDSVLWPSRHGDVLPCGCRFRKVVLWIGCGHVLHIACCELHEPHHHHHHSYRFSLMSQLSIMKIRAFYTFESVSFVAHRVEY